MAVTKEILIKDYSRAIHEGNAAIFAGAGLSRSSGYVDWKELLGLFRQHIRMPHKAMTLCGIFALLFYTNLCDLEAKNVSY